MTIKEEFGAPDGWQWYGRDTRGAAYGGVFLLHINWEDGETNVTRENDPLANKFENLSNWANENDLEVRKYTEHTIRFNVLGVAARLPIADYVVITRKSEENPNAAAYRILTMDEKICESCETVHPNRSLVCTNCEALFYCSCCGRRRNAAWIENLGTQIVESYCSSCGVPCPSCEGRYYSGRYSSCTTCEPRFYCSQCRDYLPGTGNPLPISLDGQVFCDNCIGVYCTGCDSFSSNRSLIPNEQDELRCSRCLMLGNDGDKEVYDDNSSLSEAELFLPSLEGREFVRKCGVEIEGVGGRPAGDLIAQKLYSEGLNNYDTIQPWHRGDGFARVETDSSVDWELIIGPINMDNMESVRKLNTSVRIVKEAIKQGNAKLDLRCGTHIHVAADKISLAQAYNLHIIYAHIEDVMYRLGSAHWPIHRSIIQQSDGHEYCSVAPKQDTKTKFARQFHGEENRYFGLSFHNYFEAMLGRCACGATRYGVFEECECNLGKCTFEFRLFNATANTIKLHAYLALCQALVAKAISMPEIKDPQEFSANNFVSKRFKDMTDSEKEEANVSWEEGMKFISELPMTPKEKKSVLYCIENSELKKVNNSIKQLFVLQEGE